MTRRGIDVSNIYLVKRETDIFSRFVLIKERGFKSLTVSAPCGNPEEL